MGTLVKTSLVAALLLSISSVCSAETRSAANSPQSQRVGLVLSGGGAKGIAEIGAIQAFEENDIPIDYITGTSMGAIVGGLYAAGYSPAEMMDLLESKMFLNASTGTIDPNYYYMFFTPEQRPSMLNVSFSLDSITKSRILPSSLISPMPMNFAFMSIFSSQTAQCGGDFDRLFVPLRTVSSDMTHKRKKVFSKGQLDDAVRASMSFPIVFKPVKLDGAMLYDGGIYDNFPFDVMKEDFDPDVMIGVDIHGTDTIHGFPDILQQMDLLVIRNTNNYDLPEDYGIKLRIDLNRFGLLDFQKAKEIYEIGYKHALEMVDSIKTRVTARRPAAEVVRRRAEFRANRPEVVFESVTVDGAKPSENNYIRYFFEPEKADTFGLANAMDAYTKVLSTGMLRDLDPQAKYNPATGRFNLALNADVKDNFDVGLGGYFSSSVNSMLFFHGGYNSFSFRSLDAAVNAWIGQSYMAGELNARAVLRDKQNSSIGFQSVVWRQKFHESDKLFYQDDSPAFITNLEFFTRVKAARSTGRHSEFDGGIAYGYHYDRFYDNDASVINALTQRNRISEHLGQAMASWRYNNLDNQILPTSGRYIGVMLQGLMGRLHCTPGRDIALYDAADLPADLQPISKTRYWAQGEFRIRNYFNLDKHWSLGLESTVLASSRPLLDNYNAAMVDAPAFNPTSTSYNIFNPLLRANQFVTLGAVPVWKISDRIEMRGSFHGFLPFRRIKATEDGGAEYGKWFRDPRFFGELSAAVKLPFGNLRVYGTYQNSPGDKWGVGVSFGYFILAPRLTRL